MTRTRSVPSAIVVVVLVAVLAGCGPMPEPTPTTTPETTPPVEESAATPGTPASAELTLGELAERVNAAWPTVRSYRITFTGSTSATSAGVGTPVARPLATPGATPMATPGATPVARPRETFVSIREVVLPDRQRQDVRGLGENDHEAIAIGDRLYRPRAACRADRAGDPGRRLDRRRPIDSARGLGALTPAGRSARDRRQRHWRRSRSGCCRRSSARWATVEHDGRECRVYGAADTVPATGMRVDYTIAVDDRDIPCFIETERRWRDAGSRRIQRHRRLVHHRAAAGGNSGERATRAGHTAGPRLKRRA